MMTVEELTERARDLEEVLQLRIEDFERLHPPARVAAIRVLEQETSRNQKLEIQLEPALPAKTRWGLGRDLLKLFRGFQKETGCRVTEMLVEHLLVRDGDEIPVRVELRVDLLAYPRRLLAASRRVLEEDIAGLLYSFGYNTQGRVLAVDVAEEDEEHRYRVRVKLDPNSGG